MIHKELIIALGFEENQDFMCNLELSAIEVSLVNVMNREIILKSIINQCRESYEYVLMIVRLVLAC